MNKDFPAFPVPPKELGMTLRDYFAAAAAKGYCGNPQYDWSDDEIAAAAYAVADSMLFRRLEK